jgi:hypothetical protein
LDNERVVVDEARALAELAGRRQAGGEFDRAELARRIDDLGDIVLSKAVRHGAFAELYAAYTPRAFRLVPFPDDSSISVAGHRIRVKAVIVDETHGQVVAEIVRDVVLDQGVVHHELLRVQDAYRGDALSYVLLDQALPVYRQLELQRVLVHAAMETGRWHWARLGFDFLDDNERGLVMGWATMALIGLGRAPLDPASPARRLAQLGTGSPTETATLDDVRLAVQAQLAIWTADPGSKAVAEALAAEWDRRSLAETDGQVGMLDPGRLQAIAGRNGVDWWGAFDLADQASLDAFGREFSRRFSGR